MYIIVGAGFFGSVLAERIANVLNEKVLILEKKDHTGGNCHSYTDSKTNIEVHKYGSHIFHTNNHNVWNYINKFSGFTNYQHKVWIDYKNKIYSMPINLATINNFYGLSLKPSEVASFINKEIAKENITAPKNLEEKAISLIGRPLYEAFIKGYTEKQWEKPAIELPEAIINRLPFRLNYNNNYFNDIYQGMPADGYFSIFNKMLTNKNIEIWHNADYSKIKSSLPAYKKLIYTGMLDEFFNYKYGMLDYRNLRFEYEYKDIQDFQGTPVINYAERSIPYTRIHEFKHYHPERVEIFNSNKTLISYEYSVAHKIGEDAYYPINDSKNNDRYNLYKQEADKIPNLIVGGRLGSYKYWDMDKTIESALTCFEEKIKNG